ncbi:small secreted protein [Fusarium austroafricanum]|uniref:Small secreted protein n=1 Tax=Fusarium austroafricanum TaxID=2364996 RepID=A0A8H4KNK3_9HYPO|nr:small secreted protein [Fusarium austroafricanum]
MKFSAAVFTLIAATGVSAAPAADSVNMMAATPQWTIRDAKRYCRSDDSVCFWKFGVDTGNGKPTECKYEVKGPKASKARAAGPFTCGDYTVTSGWSDQFGPNNGFTTLSVVSKSKKQIIWPAYTDKQLAGGKIVKPDQSYAPASLPK